MESWFAEHGLPLMRFIEISTLFLMVMLSYLDRKAYDKHRWIHHLFLGVLIAYWGIALVFEPLQTKMFATLMLLSVIVVETVIKRPRRNSV
jgi:uncharacterized membrane protein HdeD (DUF308 family)